MPALDCSSDPDPGARIAAWIAAGRAAIPAVTAPDPAIAAHLAAHALDPRAERGDELFLAAACAAGDSAAIATLERRHAATFDAVIGRFARVAGRDELRQIVREHLFVAPRGAAPRIAAYAGRGFLDNWLRIAILRICLNAIRRADPLARTGDDSLGAVPAPGRDLELGFLHDRYRAEFRAAFARAVAGLDGSERALLRLGLVEGLGVDQIGAALGVHRATAARRLARARQRLLADTVTGLKAALAIDDAELASLHRAIDTHLDLSLSRLLAAPADAA